MCPLQSAHELLPTEDSWRNLSNQHFIITLVAAEEITGLADLLQPKARSNKYVEMIKKITKW